MNPIIKILMTRDEMTKEEAIEYFEDFLESIEDYILEGDYVGIEEEMLNTLCLEMDYLPYVLGL